jgi:hypothetical protein
MRNSTRLRFFLATAATAALTAAFIACGGSDNQDVITVDAGQEASRPDTSVEDTGVQDANKPDATEAGPGYDAGPIVILDAGPEYDGGIVCRGNGVIEEEPNDDPDAANQLRYDVDAACLKSAGGCTRCGVIFLEDPDSGADAGDGGTEVEFVTFDLQPTTKSFYVEYEGDVTLTITIDGEAGTYVVGKGQPPVTIPAKLGKHYYVEVTSNTGKITPWRVTLYETQ